ncbi:MAG: uroporphyrinogen decarboxylase family protein [Marinilabiliaceae bacterium]|jgi:hypothetical protein|nr:uroporphyrinogen decarboxylase family protein [Marinilabiliaceae bacterium]
MTSKERIQKTLNHIEPDKVAVDFGATGQTGIHIAAIGKLRNYFGLKNEPVKVLEPFQMLGEIDDELLEILGGDVIGLNGHLNMFGIPQENFYEFRTFWGQTVLMPEKISPEYDEFGDLIVYPRGDKSTDPSAKMPKTGYFFDATNRVGPVDEASLNVEDNLEEFGYISDEELHYWKRLVDRYENSDKALLANFGGTALGDVALVPGIQLKNPKGVRDITDWYISTMIRPDFMKELFDRQTDIAIENLKRIYQVAGNRVDAIFLCGTDFGTQNSTFVDVPVYRDIWMPYYKKVSQWVHENTRWKLFKHSCGAVEPLIESFIDSGIDILNPVQTNAAGMDPKLLKEKYGRRIVFWGGGVDTQKVLPYGSTSDVEKQVIEHLKIFSKGGGYVFNTVHNTQPHVPVENFVAMLNAIRSFNGDSKL